MSFKLNVYIYANKKNKVSKRNNNNNSCSSSCNDNNADECFTIEELKLLWTKC